MNPAPVICRANAGPRDFDQVVSNFANTIPDMKFDIKEVLVADDRVIVRGEVTGTPAAELFGVPHSGKSFRIMAGRHPDHPGRQNCKDVPHGELAQRDRPARAK